jgi:hypothetical protein
MSDPKLTVRVTGVRDSRVLELLARAAGRSQPLPDRALLAERDGVSIAAIGLTTGTVLADPGNPSLDVVSALRFTRYRIMRQGGQAGAARSLLARPASRAVLSASRP